MATRRSGRPISGMRGVAAPARPVPDEAHVAPSSTRARTERVHRTSAARSAASRTPMPCRRCRALLVPAGATARIAWLGETERGPSASLEFLLPATGESATVNVLERAVELVLFLPDRPVLEEGLLHEFFSQAAQGVPDVVLVRDAE